MEDSAGSRKPWDHAWNTEEMRKNRRNWSLAGDSGLLKHLQQFSEDLIAKANETRNSIDSMTADLDKTAILVDNITNTSLALANTQFIESRVQEDSIETEQPVEDTQKRKNDCEISATDLLVSVCESIKQGLLIMDEKYERVETLATHNADGDNDTVPSFILRPKDPYKHRPLPYVIGTEQWTLSSKVGLESSSSDSEQDDEDEDSVGGADIKTSGNLRNSNLSVNSGISRLSTTSNESNDLNIDTCDIKSNNSGRSLTRSRDPVDLDAESPSPSSMVKTPNISNGPPSFAEELAKRLGGVKPFQNIVAASEVDEPPIESLKDNNSSLGGRADGTSDHRRNNPFPSEASPSAWKNKPVRPTKNNIIPPSIDVPPPLSIVSTAPKSNFDDLFGNEDDSEDSDDIFSNKSSKNIFTVDRGPTKTESNKPKLPNAQNVQSISAMTTSTPETNDREKSLFSDDDEEEDDLFRTTTRVTKSSEGSALLSDKKKPVGGVSIFGKVDILSSSKFARRDSSSSSNASEEHQQQPQKSRVGSSTLKSAPRSGEASAAGPNVTPSSFSGNNSSNNNFIGNSAIVSNSSSGISVRQPSVDNTAGSSLGADFQPLMSSSRLKSEETYRDRVASDSLFATKSKTGSTSSGPAQQQQQQQQQQSSQSTKEDVSGHEDVFGPPPLPKSSDSKPKSKVASLFDDSDSGDDLFASPSPGSVRSGGGDRPAATTAPSTSRSKRLNLFDDDDGDEGGSEERLFGARDAPGVNLFSSAPISSISRIADGLFDGLDAPAESKPAAPARLEPSKSKPARGLFDDLDDSDDADSDLFAAVKAPKPSSSLGAAKAAPVASKGIFDDPPDLFPGIAASSSVTKKSAVGSETSASSPVDGSRVQATAPRPERPTKVKPSKSLFDDDDDDDDSEEGLFAKSKAVVGSKVGASKPVDSSQRKSSPDPPKTEKPANTRPKVSLFDDDDDEDLFSGSSSSSARKAVVGSKTNVNKPVESSKVRGEQAGSSLPKLEPRGPPETEKSANSTPKADIFDKGAGHQRLFQGSSSSTSANKTVIGSETSDPPRIHEGRKDSLKAEPQSRDPPQTDEATDTRPKTSLFDDNDDSEEGLFGSKTVSGEKKTVVGSETSVSEPIESSRAHVEQQDSTPKNSESPDAPKTEKAASIRPKTSLFDDDDNDEEDLFSGGSSTSKRKIVVGSEKSAASNTVGSLRVDEEQKSFSKAEPRSSDLPKTEKVAIVRPKASLFDDDDDDEEDLFSGTPKKPLGSRTKEMEGEERKEGEKPVKPSASVEPVEQKKVSEPPGGRGEFDDDDEDDLFAAKKKEAIPAAEREKPQSSGGGAETEQSKKPAVPERSAVDGAVSSKRSEPPASLKVHPVLPKLDVAAANSEAAKSDRAAPAKPAVSGKIKNLMGKMGDLKILSPTDTPPLFRKNAQDRPVAPATPANDETNDEELVRSDNSSPSLPSDGSSPLTSGTNSRTRDSPSLISEQAEVAISFDEPAQVETLTSTASKTRPRIQAKRRPQSRQARQSALRHSGIDFDVVDTAPASLAPSQPNGNASEADLLNVDQHQRTKTQQPDSLLRPSSLAHGDDKSEISASRNTTTNLLSPSTDEEDLFDVLPDLPEDPAAREDSLFVRAPILSPVEPNIGFREKPKETLQDDSSAVREGKPVVEGCDRKDEEVGNVDDPLRDQSHDPLEDPSQLFPFVTKTPSPEKSKGLLANEDDDSLFSSSSKAVEKKMESKSKPTSSLFSDEDDESSSDLFSSSKARVRPLKDTKIDLFNDSAVESDDDNLFGTAKIDEKKNAASDSTAATTAKTDQIDEKDEAKVPNAAMKNILDDSSGEDDIFAGSKKPLATKKTKSLFDESDDDDGDLFGKSKPLTSKEKIVKPKDEKPVSKRAATRDLKKTAEQIAEDPLSLLQED